jgi:acyl-CoA reductase-like NAD-dependent aldehyde dehydrogenase
MTRSLRTDIQLLDAGIELTTNPMVDLISFTGSDAVGRQVYEQAAATIEEGCSRVGRQVGQHHLR